MISIVGLLALAGSIVGGYLTIKNGWYSQALMAIAGLSGLICGIIGIVKLTDHADKNDVVGSILIGIGIITLLVVGVMIKILFRKETTANKAIEATS